MVAYLRSPMMYLWKMYYTYSFVTHDQEKVAASEKMEMTMPIDDDYDDCSSSLSYHTIMQRIYICINSSVLIPYTWYSWNETYHLNILRLKYLPFWFIYFELFRSFIIICEYWCLMNFTIFKSKCVLQMKKNINNIPNSRVN